MGPIPHAVDGAEASHEAAVGRENMAHIRQPRPNYGLHIQVKVLKTFQVVPSSLGSGPGVPRS